MLTIQHRGLVVSNKMRLVDMKQNQIQTLVQIAKVVLEHKESAEIVARELGLTEEELDEIYASLAD